MKPRVLFIAQYILFALIILTGQIIPKQFPFFLLFLVGIVIAILSLTSKKSPKQKNIFYSVVDSIQHPFYTTIVVTTLALVLDLYTYERLIIWMVLFVVILMRLQEKEGSSKKRKGAKSKSTAAAYRLIPFIY